MSATVLLRGLMRETRHWGDFPERLGAVLVDRPLVALDLPGNGRLHRQQSPSRVADMVAFARADLARRGFTPPYRLVALSLGGMVAVSWAGSEPIEIDAAVLLNTSLRPFSPFYRRLRPACYPRLLRLALLNGGDAAWENAIFALTSTRTADRASIVADWITWRRQYTVSRANALRQIVAAMRFSAPETPPRCPLLVLASAGDRLVDPDCSRTLAAHWQADYAEHPAAGHDLPLDASGWVIEQISAWGRRLSPPRR